MKNNVAHALERDNEIHDFVRTCAAMIVQLVRENLTIDHGLIDGIAVHFLA